ncbi:MAG: ATP-binding protein [Gemmatimonadetes bacterium]|nr:ATP-binding protein [Gemmatimonadota bacterium]
MARGGLSSLRSRLTVWYAILLGVPLAAFAIVGYVVFARTLVSRTDRFIGDALTVFSAEVAVERRRTGSVTEAITTTANEVRFRNLRIIVRDGVGAVVAMHIDADARLEADADPVLAALAGQSQPSEAMTVGGPSGGDRVITRELVVEGESFTVSGAFPLTDVDAVLERIRLTFGGAIPLLLLLAGTGAWFLAHRGLAPVAAMTDRAGNITASNLSERLPVAGDAELTGLARVINELLDRLEDAFARQKRFMADASHELRTPTAIIRTEADVTLARPERTSAEYRQSIGVMLDASKRLTRIVDDLFLLARADAGHLELRSEAIYLEEVVDDATRAIAQVGEQREVRVELRHMVQAPFTGDPDLLGRVLLNLLDNAIKHSPARGTVSVDMAREGAEYVISVIDGGQGIPPENLDSLFDRFFRGDSARGRTDNTATDGAGLGLAITRRIAVAHGGRLELASSRPGHTEFRLALPAP